MGLVRWTAASLAIAVGLGIFWGHYIEPNLVLKSQVEVPIKGLPKQLDGFRIVHISDIHIQRMGRRERAAVRIVNEARPDIIAMTGDYAGGAWGARTDEASWEFAFFVRKLRARYGVYGVWGDWDYSDVMRSRAARYGLKPLFNTAANLRVNGACLSLMGIGLNIRDLDAAVAASEPGCTKILLCHEAIPESVTLAAEQGVSLALIGGEHGGQVRLPLIGSLRSSGHYGREYTSGLHRVHDSMYLYANRGLGMSNFSVRFMCPPEVAVITLRSK